VGLDEKPVSEKIACEKMMDGKAVNLHCSLERKKKDKG
jgi:hypothetical protein